MSENEFKTLEDLRDNYEREILEVCHDIEAYRISFHYYASKLVAYIHMYNLLRCALNLDIVSYHIDWRLQTYTIDKNLFRIKESKQRKG